jgi:hypothetical protein
MTALDCRRIVVDRRVGIIEVVAAPGCPSPGPARRRETTVCEAQRTTAR